MLRRRQKERCGLAQTNIEMRYNGKSRIPCSIIQSGLTLLRSLVTKEPQTKMRESNKINTRAARAAIMNFLLLPCLVICLVLPPPLSALGYPHNPTLMLTYGIPT